MKPIWVVLVLVTTNLFISVALYYSVSNTLYDLEPEIYSVGLLRRWLDFNGRSPSHKIHLKLDTGMRRLGFEAGDLAALLPLLSKELKVASVFSHLAASEAPEHDEFTRRQAASFMEMYEPIANALGYRPLRHILNFHFVRIWRLNWSRFRAVSASATCVCRIVSES